MYKLYMYLQTTKATIHYVIKDQQIYSKRLGSITDFKMFVDGMLHSLVRKVKIPDIEFVFNVGDWVRVNQSVFKA